MKNMLLVALLVVSQAAFAQKKAAEPAKAAAATEASTSHLKRIKELQEKIAKGSELTGVEKNELRNILKDVLSGPTIGVSRGGLEALILMKPSLIHEISKRAEILKSEKSTTPEKTKAETELEILANGARFVDMNAKDGAENLKTLETAINIASESSSSFKEKLKENLKTSTDVDQAVLKSSEEAGRKFTSKELKEKC